MFARSVAPSDTLTMLQALPTSLPLRLRLKILARSIYSSGSKEMRYQDDDVDIEERLKGDLAKARAEYDAAHKEFDLLIKDIPSEIPQPDGSLRIRQAGEASRVALQNYRRALKRFSDYAFSGAMPKDLLPPD